MTIPRVREIHPGDDDYLTGVYLGEHVYRALPEGAVFVLLVVAPGTDRCACISNLQTRALALALAAKWVIANDSTEDQAGQTSPPGGC